MRCHSSMPASETLYRILSIPQHSTHSLRPAIIPWKPSHILAQRRRIGRYAKPKDQSNDVPSPFHDPQHPLDEAIPSAIVHWVDAKGELQRKRSLPQLLRSIDRTTHHIRSVALDDDDRLPVVKIVSRQYLQHELQVKLMYKKAQKAPEQAKKELEMSWGIDQGGDLLHRLSKMESFLKEGRAVDVLLAPKKGGRKASQDEMETLVDKVKEAALRIQGVREAKALEGEIGKQALLHFKASKVEKVENEDDEAAAMSATRSKAEALLKDRDEKKAEKERKKAAWKAELEDRARRKQEREKEIQSQRAAQVSA